MITFRAKIRLYMQNRLIGCFSGKALSCESFLSSKELFFLWGLFWVSKRILNLREPFGVLVIYFYNFIKYYHQPIFLPNNQILIMINIVLVIVNIWLKSFSFEETPTNATDESFKNWFMFFLVSDLSISARYMVY